MTKINKKIFNITGALMGIIISISLFGLKISIIIIALVFTFVVIKKDKRKLIK